MVGVSAGVSRCLAQSVRRPTMANVLRLRCRNIEWRRSLRYAGGGAQILGGRVLLLGVPIFICDRDIYIVTTSIIASRRGLFLNERHILIGGRWRSMICALCVETSVVFL